MRYLKSALVAAGLLAGMAMSPGAHAASMALASTARAQYCAARHSEVPDYLFPAWVKNHCTKAPYGVKFDYLAAGWRCLCTEGGD